MAMNAVNSLMKMAQTTCISVEAPVEHNVQQILYDGVEIRQHPPTMSENLTKLAQKIDFDELEENGETKEPEAGPPTSTVEVKKEKEEAPAQLPQWQWDSVRSKLRNALTEASVLLDVMQICHEKKYMVLDPVIQESPPRRPVIQMLAKKKGQLLSSVSI
jgi:mediator of RNA polymerase II transcription subunit 17